MTNVPEFATVESALGLLAAGPLRPVEICSRVLAVESVKPEMAEKLISTLLGPDPRFRRVPDGAWALAAAGPSSSSRALELERAAYVVVDVETTGFKPPGDRVIELGMVRVEGARIVDRYETLINPRRPIPAWITSFTGITWSMVAESPSFEEVCGTFLDFLGDSVFVAHNASFDWRFIQSELSLVSGRKLLNGKLCTKKLTHRLLPELERRRLDDLAHFFNLSFSARHRALGDALVTAEVLLRFIERALEKGITTVPELFDFLDKPRTRPRRL
ncbi:MAG: 3'-5' exonuclease [Gemmatimonadota bacterium]|nr:3'-5' exonuclease [Gemmatimonadota bacterium]